MTPGKDNRPPEEGADNSPPNRAEDVGRDARPTPADGSAEQPVTDREPGAEQAAGSAQPSGADGPAASDTQGGGAFPESSADGPDQEEALRRLMRDVVGDLEPSANSLEHLRQAVPARRARRRQTLVGATAAVLVVAVAVPALMHTGVMPGPLNDRHANAASSDQADVTDGELGHLDGGSTAAPSGKDAGRGAGAGGKDRDGSSASPSEGSSASPGSTDDLASTSPRCTRDQLGEARVRVDDPDSLGRVQGSFRLTNVSGDTCRVKGTDELVASAQGKADPAGVQVLDHTEGGKAPGLPSPSQADADLILRPGESYQVRFAWLPGNERGGCRVDPGPAPSPDPDPTPSDPTTGGSQTGGGSGGQSGGTSGSGGDGGEDAGGSEGGDETASGGGSANEQSAMNTLADSGTGSSGDTGSSSATAVVLRYTPAAGEPHLPRAYLNNACAGTVYRTGVLPAS